MNSNTLLKWLFMLIITLSVADPMSPCPPNEPPPKESMPPGLQPSMPLSYPMPYPMPMGIGVGIAVVQEQLSSTTTTTTEKTPMDNVAIALSMPPMPIPLPMGVAAPIPPIPMPFNMPMGFGIAVIQSELNSATTTTTTTTAKPFIDRNGVLNIPGGVDNIAIALPMPPMSALIPMGESMPPTGMLVPQPVQFAVPGAMPAFCRKDKRHPSCPPCPPCSCQPCTPSFFSYCSQCHQKCRCKSSKDIPIPLPPNPPVPLPGPAFPMPLPMPFMAGSIPVQPQVVIIPYPPEMVPQNQRKQRADSCEKHTYEDSIETSDSSDNQDYESDSNIYNFSRKMKRKPLNVIYKNRKAARVRNDNDVIIKPELNYINDNGVVKLKKNLNRGEALKLMADNDDTIHIGAGDFRNRRRKYSKISTSQSKQWLKKRNKET